jgi:hypothetical protein
LRDKNAQGRDFTTFVTASITAGNYRNLGKNSAFLLDTYYGNIDSHSGNPHKDKPLAWISSQKFKHRRNLPSRCELTAGTKNLLVAESFR